MARRYRWHTKHGFANKLLTKLTSVLLIIWLIVSVVEEALVRFASLSGPGKTLLLIGLTLFGCLLLYSWVRAKFLEAEEKRQRLLNLAELEKIKTLTPFQFEEYVKEIFLRQDWDRVELTPRTNDGGKDLILWKDNNTVLVECKKWNKPIGRPVVQKLHSAQITCGAVGAYIITTDKATKPAEDYARDVGIEIITGEELSRLARHAFHENNNPWLNFTKFSTPKP